MGSGAEITVIFARPVDAPLHVTSWCDDAVTGYWQNSNVSEEEKGVVVILVIFPIDPEIILTFFMPSA